MHARILSPRDLSCSDIARWRELQAASPHLRSPFFSPEFTRAIAEARGDVSVAVLRSNREIVGFFPFHRLAGGVAKPVGGPISDYQGPVLAPESNLDATHLLSLCKLTAYDFNHAPVAAPLLSIGSVHRAVSPHIDLREGFARYLAGRAAESKDTVRSVERRRRKTERELGPLRLEMDDSSSAAWDWLVAHKSAYYARIGVPSAFVVPWIARALDSIRSLRGRAFAGRLHMLYAGERPIAAQFGMRAADTLAWWFTTYDDDLRNLGPGTTLLLLAAERGAEEGIQMIDFGRGDESYKLAFANGATELCEGSIECASTIPGVLRRVQKATLKGLAHVPLGRYESWPRRAIARLGTGMRLPA